MVNLTIDNINVSVPEGTTIMDAAKMADIPIPKLCYLKDINEIAACRVCVVELEGMERLVTYLWMLSVPQNVWGLKKSASFTAAAWQI